MTTTAELARIALHPDVTRDDVDDAMCARGWLLVSIVPADEQNPAQSIFLTKDRRGLLYFVEDGMIDASYFVVRGAGIDASVDEIRASLRTLSKSDLVTAATMSSDPRDAARALLLLGVTTLDRDGDVMALLERSRAHESEIVANAAMMALRTLAPELHPVPSESEDAA